MYETLVLIHFVCLILCMGLLMVSIAIRNSESQKYLVLITISVTVNAFGYFGAILANTPEAAIICDKIQIFGLIFVNTFMVFFIAKCCNYTISIWFRYFLLFFDFFACILIVTYDYHVFFYRSIEFIETGLYPHIDGRMGYGEAVLMLFNLFLIIYQLIILFNFYNSKVFKSDKGMRKILLIPFTYVLPLFSCVYKMVGMNKIYSFVPYTFSMVVSLIYFSVLVYKFRFSDSEEVAKEDIIQNIDEGFVVIDIAGNLLFANRKAYSIFPTLHLENKRKQVISDIFKENKKKIELDNRIYFVSVVPFYNQKILKGYNIWLFDKTDEKEFTEKLVELKEEAENASRAKTIFLANMSHEIRTPMNAILGTTEILLREDLPEEQYGHVQSIKEAGIMLMSIINDILDFSKIEAGKMEDTPENYKFAPFLKNITNQVNETLNSKGIEFNISVKDSIPSVLRGDDTHVRQIIMNFLSNAVKYTKEGHISFDVDWKLESGNICRLIFTVEDSGCGIPKENIDTLFDSFARADLIKNRTIEGTGLGLAIAKKMIEGMNGEVSVTSEYGKGSVFTFSLCQQIVSFIPVGNFQKVSVMPEKEEEEDNFVAPMARILAVDDNATNRKVIEGLLTTYGIKADVVASGEECLKKLETNSYHLIFMDHMMPIMDGIETTAHIRRLEDKDKRNIPIVALTANAIKGSKDIFLNNGFQDYLTKPMDMRALEKILKKYIPHEMIQYINTENPEAAPGKEIVIPNVDVERGLSNYGNSRSQYFNILKYIYDDGAEQIERMQDQIDAMDSERLSFEVHALKGLADGIGADELRDMAKAIESEIKEGETPSPEETGKLLYEYELLLANIKFTLTENGISLSDEIVITEEPLSEEKKEEALKSILFSLDMLEQNKAEEEIRKVLETGMDITVRSELEVARRDIKDFEYENAKRHILKAMGGIK